jgi:ribosomal protein S12 methylthiotransferase
MKFDRLGAFTYSHEENTHAYGMVDDVPAGVKELRAQEIMELQGGISFEKNQARVGQVMRVLVDKAENGHYIARTEFDSPEVDNEVLIPMTPLSTGKGQGVRQAPLSTGEGQGVRLRIGDFAEVRIVSAREHELFGEPV